MKNILITGATGVVGLPLRALLAERGIPARLILRKKTSLFKNETAVFTNDFFNESPDFFENALNNIQSVIHLAWYTEHGKYQHSNLNSVCKNASFEFAKMALKNNVEHFIGIGTCYEYQKQKEPLDISTPLKPFTPYGKAKAELYFLLNELFNNTKTRFSWVRLFYMFGENENPNRLTPSLHHYFQNKKNITIQNANAVLDFLNTKNVAEELLKLVFSKEKTQNNAYNICSGCGIHLKQYAENFAKQYKAEHLLTFKNTETPDFIVGIPTEIK